MLFETTWRTERILNWARVGIWVIVGLTLNLAWALESWSVPGTPMRSAIQGLVFLAWGGLLAGFSQFVLRRRFRPWFPAAITITDLTVLGTVSVAIGLQRTSPPPDVDGMMDGVSMGMMCILAFNALRFDWPVSLITGIVGTLTYIAIHAILLGIDPFILIDITIFLSITAVLTVANFRTRRLIRDLFSEMKGLQEQRVQLMGRLVAGVLHELNTPLGTLRSSFQTVCRAGDKLTEEGTEPAQRARAAKVLAEANGAAVGSLQRLDQVLEAFKSFSRPDQAEVQTVDIHEGLDSGFMLASGEFDHPTGIERRYGQLPKVRCRPMAINQVFLNLLKNAIEASPRDQDIVVETQEKEDYVEVRIRDHGPGLSPELLARAFEPTFVRGRGRVKLGLGLAASRSIVQDHGGDLFLESRPGDGTVAIVRLPVDMVTTQS